MKKDLLRKTQAFASAPGSPLTEQIKGFCYLILCPAIIFICMEWYLRNPFMEKWGIKAVLFIVNLLIFYILEFLFYAITGSLRASLYILSVLSFIFGITEHYVYSFRGSTLVPWDFLSLKTALSVSDNYEFKPDKTTVILTLIFILMWISLIFCNISIKNKKKLRLTTGILSFLMLFLVLFPFVQSENTIKTLKVYDKLFTPATMTMRDGMFFSFVYNMQFLNVKKPGGYNSDSIRSSLFTDYGGEEGVKIQSGNELPNIIVIVCEAFSDPAVLGDFNVNTDYMPFIRSLINDGSTVSGTLNVSVIGGNTPNTEYEFLTGNTMAFLPAGSVPFLQFVKHKTDALPSYLKDLGYRTVAMHPYGAKGWDRNRVYPLLGFEKMYFSDSFLNSSPEYIRKYISDRTLFNKITELYKENVKETPLFSYNVTMQNHSDYTQDFDNFTPDIEIEGVKGIRPAERYLSLEKITDQAFKEFISYFDSISDPTLVVFFGDHQPADSVVEPIWNLNNKKGSELKEDDLRKRYKVPFLIWANYPLDGASDLELSTNYLGNLVLKSAGIDIAGYRAFLNEQYKEAPVITSVYTSFSDGRRNSADIDDEALQNYRRMQYYEMFDDTDTLE